MATNGENSEKSAAERAYATLEAVSHLLQNTPPTHAAFVPLCHLTLRAVLHPALEPYLHDPLLLLGGDYVSLDARASGIVGFLRENPNSRALLTNWPASDHALLSRVAGPSEKTPAVQIDLQAMVGKIEGALYLSGTREAVACRVWATCDTASLPQNHWPRPTPLRPVSDALAHSAWSALAAAVAFLEETGLPPGLRPVPLYYDVCLIGEAFPHGDAQIGAASGDSLGLPLALAFLSALLSAPIFPFVGATGALGKNNNPADVFPVQWVEEKARALFAVWNNHHDGLFFAPTSPSSPAMPFVRTISSIGGAARTLFPDSTPAKATRVSVPAAAHTATTLVAIFEADGNDSETMRVVSDLARRAIETHGGAFLVDDEDAEALCATFPDAETACRAALAVQQAVYCHLWPGKTIPGVQMGVDADSTARDLAHLVPRATQIARSASPRQILLSGNARASLPTLPADIRLTGQGSHRLGDLLPPLALFQLSSFGPDTFAPPQTLDARPHNLPIVTAPLVGRASEVKQIARLLQSGVPLVTLTGPGGVGKTRVALEAAARCSGEQFPGGVWFVSLVVSETRDAVAGKVAEVLQFPSDAPDEVMETLAGRAPTLLLLDTGETVSPGASAFITQIRRTAPAVTVLLAARAPLRTPGEVMISLPPLSQGDAVRLFEQRVQAHRPDSADLDPEMMREICRVAGGLPLALELAAAQTRHSSLAEIAERLGQASGQNKRQAARQTLEALTAFLPGPEQELLARVSVFADGFTAEAAMALDTEGDHEETADALIALEEAALLQRHSAQENDAQNRYFLLPAVRAFAARCLAASAVNEKAAQEAQARYFQNRVRLLLGMDETGAETVLFDALAPDKENLRLTQTWLRENDSAALPGFVQAVVPFLRARNYRREENDWLLAALLAADAHPGMVPPRVRAWLHMDRANYCLDRPAPGGEMEYHLQAAEQWASAADFPLMRANVQNTRGFAAARNGDGEAAQVALEEARALYRLHGSRGGEAGALKNLALVYLEMGDKERARQCYEKAAALCHQAQDKHGLAFAVNSLGYLAGLDGDLDTARTHFIEVLDLAHETKNAFQIALALLNLGDVEEQTGEIEQAVPLLALAETIFARLGHPLFQEAGKYLARASGAFATETLTYLRRDWERRSLDYLLRLDPRPELRNV